MGRGADEHREPILLPMRTLRKSTDGRIGLIGVGRRGAGWYFRIVGHPADDLDAALGASPTKKKNAIVA
jgi:hypothetical protein